MTSYFAAMQTVSVPSDNLHRAHCRMLPTQMDYDDTLHNDRDLSSGRVRKRKHTIASGKQTAFQAAGENGSFRGEQVGLRLS